MADSFTVAGVALNSHEPVHCATVSSSSANAVTGAALNEHECTGCGGYHSGNSYVTGVATNTYDIIACPFILGVSPDAITDEWLDVDLVYSVWTNIGQQLTLDNATVEWVAAVGDTPIITHSTDDYSVITFGNTMVVHLDPTRRIGGTTLTYTATITTNDAATYTMTGELFIEPISSVYRLLGLYPHPDVQLLGVPQAEVRLLGTPQEQQRSGFGTLTTTNPRMLGTQPKTSVRLFGMLQEIDKN